MPLSSDDSIYHPGTDVITTAQFPETSEAVQQRVDHSETFGDILKYGAVSAMAGFADTVLQGVGADDATVGKILTNMHEPLGQFYTRNQEGARAAGDILGLLPIAIAGSTLIRAPNYAGRLLQKIAPGNKYVSAVLSTGRPAWDAAGNTVMRAKVLAAKGQKDFDISTSLVRDGGFVAQYKSDRRTHVLDMVKENIAAEVAIIATMHESDILFPEELSFVEQAAWMVPFHGLAAGAAWWTFKSAVQRRLIQETGPIAGKYGNPMDLPKSEVFYRPDDGTGNVNRGSGITMESVLRNAAASDLSRAADTIEATNIENTIKAYDTTISGEMVNLFRDNPVPGWTSRTNVTEGDAAVNTAMHVSKQDPILFAQVRSLEPYSADFAASSDKLQSRAADELEYQINTLMDAGGSTKQIDHLQKKLDALIESTAIVLEPDGTSSLLSRRRPIYQDGKMDINKVKLTNEPSIYAVKIDNPRGIFHSLGVAEDLSVRMAAPKSRLQAASFEWLTPMEATSLWAAQRKAMDNFRMVDDKGMLLPPIHVTADAHFVQLDGILGLHKQMGDEVFARFKMPEGLRTVEQIELASLAGKFTAFQKMQGRAEFMAESSIGWARKNALNKETMAKMLNLPGDDTAGMSPIMALFSDMYRGGREYDLRSFFTTLDEVKEGMVRLHAPHELGSPLKDSLAMHGSMLTMPTDRAPIVAIIRDMPEGPITRDRLVDAVAMQRSHVLEELKLAGNHDAHLVALVQADILARRDAFQAATDVTGLVNGTTWGKNKISNTNHQIRHVPSLVAADSLIDLSERRAIGWMKEKMEEARPAFLNLMHKNNKADSLIFDQYVHARGHGWDVLPDPVQAADGNGFHFVLDPTSEFNKKRWKELTGDDLPWDAEEGMDVFMPGAIGKAGEAPKPLYMTPHALEAARAMDQLSAEYLANINYLRYLRGQRAISRKHWYVPPKDISDKELIFLIDEQDHLHQLVAGNTYAEARLLADDEVRASGKTLRYVSREDAARFHSLMGQEFFFPVNFANPRAQTGRASGKLTGTAMETGPEVLHSRIESIQRMFDSVARETRMVIFEPQLNFMRHQMRAAGVTSTTREGQSIWQQYTNRITGIPSGKSGEFPKNLYEPIEHSYDKMLEVLAQSLPGSAHARIDSKGVTRRHEREFAALNEKVGKEFMPFSNVVDYAERTHNIKVPQSFKSHVGALNTITGALVLRIVDAGMAALNLLSLATTIPPVIRAINRGPDETVEAWKGRIGAWGSPVDDNHAFMNPSRVLYSGAHWFLNDPDAMRLMKEAGKRNYLSQDIVERTKLWIVPHDGAKMHYLRKGVDAASIMTDKTELWSRGISYAYGLYMGKHMLKLADEEAMLFAHRIANQSVGDYRPNIRPQIFQGAAGSSLGLFTTWVWTYLQRVSADIADKRMGAVLNQVGMQSMIFGMGSLPGLNQFIGTFTSNYDGSENLVTRLDKAFGNTVATDYFMRGTISNIPKLFGSENGIDMYSRGDIQVPMLTGYNVGPSAPGLSLLSNVYKAMSQSVASMKEQGWSPRQQLEILAAYSANKSFKSAVELGLDQSVDRQGSLISQTTRTGFEATARVFGTRSLIEAKKKENLQAIRVTEMKQAALLETLSLDVRAAIRAGHGTLAQDKLNKILHRYIRAGGKPENFKAYLTQQVLVAQVEKSSRVAIKAITDNATAGRAASILEQELGM